MSFALDPSRIAWGGETRPVALTALALAAALTWASTAPCLAQSDAAAGFALSAPTQPAAGYDRSVLELSPCLDAPGCGRPAQPLMPERQAIDLRSDPGAPSAVPLPAALALMGAAMAAFAMLRRRTA